MCFDTQEEKKYSLTDNDNESDYSQDNPNITKYAKNCIMKRSKKDNEETNDEVDSKTNNQDENENQSEKENKDDSQKSKNKEDTNNIKTFNDEDLDNEVNDILNS